MKRITKTNTIKIILLLISFAMNITLANAQYTKLFDFDSINGRSPFGGSLISDGTYLYGMTGLGGTDDFGVIFRIKPDGSSFQKILDFNGTNGKIPFGTLISDGTYLYGMTEEGGTDNWGVIFKIKPDGTDYTILENFNAPKGGQPLGSLILIETQLYGVARMGGNFDGGVIFKINTDGSEYTKVLDFITVIGSMPIGTLVSDGVNLYGMTIQGAENGSGSIFKITHEGTNFAFLHQFESTNGALGTHSSLFLAGDYLYGSSRQGGANGIGSVFKIKTDGTHYQNLIDFDTTANGIGFSSTLHFDGNYLYGNGVLGGTYDKGNIYRIDTAGTTYESIFDFEHPEGSAPGSDGLFDDGNYLYGMTNSGGVHDSGVIFKINKSTLSTSVENDQNQLNFKAYPNPVDNLLIIETEKSMSISVVNMLGATVLQTEIEQGNNSIDLTRLTSGFYFIHGESSVIKLMKK